MKHAVTVISGDGIGPEIVEASIQVLEATGVGFSWEAVELNAEIMQNSPTKIPDRVLQAIKENKVAIKGPISTPVGEGFTSPNVLIRRQLDLFASIRPAHSIAQYAATKKPIDVITVRENTEDVYVAIEHESKDKVVAEKVITRQASERIARCAFELATLQNRKKVTALHKADILKKADGLFLDCCRGVAKEFSQIHYEEAIIDSACMQLVLDPSRFDVMVTENMYGDIVSDIVAGIVGGLGLVGSANIGDDIAVFEAVHGSAPDIAGEGIANPTGLLRACVMMLYRLNENQAAKKLDDAINHVLIEGKVATHDLGGTVTSKEFSNKIIEFL